MAYTPFYRLISNFLMRLSEQHTLRQRDRFKFYVSSKTGIKVFNSCEWAETIFTGSAYICIIQKFWGVSIRPAEKKLILQVASN